MNWLNDFYSEEYYEYVDTNTKEYQHIHNLIEYYSKKYSIKNTTKLIDYGCGFGNIIEGLETFNYKTTGVDASEFSIKKCLDKNLNVILGNFSDIKIDKKFDIALSWNTCIGHISKESDIKFFDNVYDNLNENGIFILMVAHSEYIVKNFQPDFFYNGIKRESSIKNHILSQTWEFNNKKYNTQRILYFIPELYIMLRKFKNIEQFSYDEIGVQDFTKNCKKLILICRK